MELIMTKLLSIAATAALMLGAANAAELPNYEKYGFPITAHQIQLVGAAEVTERSPPADAREGSSASPHQRAVLTPRRE
jgi:hypothetical protein